MSLEPDLDRGLQRCEDVLLGEAADTAAPVGAPDEPDGHVAMPPGLAAYLERVELGEGSVLIRQDDAPGDLFVLESDGAGSRPRRPTAPGFDSARSGGGRRRRSPCTRGAAHRRRRHRDGAWSGV